MASTTNNSSTTEEQPKETAQELLQRLERTYNESVRILGECKDQMITQQSNVYKAFHNLKSAQEKYLIEVINHQRTQLETIKNTSESRADNL